MWWQKLRWERVEPTNAWILCPLCGLCHKMWHLQSCVFAGCILQHREYLTWLWMGVAGFDVFVLYAPGCKVSDLFVNVHPRTWALPSICGCIPPYIRTSMFLYVICRFLCVWSVGECRRMWSLWGVCGHISQYMTFWGALCGWVFWNVCLSPLCVSVLLKGSPWSVCCCLPRISGHW